MDTWAPLAEKFEEGGAWPPVPMPMCTYSAMYMYMIPYVCTSYHGPLNYHLISRPIAYRIAGYFSRGVYFVNFKIAAIRGYFS